MRDVYLDKLQVSESIRGGVVELNKNYRRIVIENSIEISFNCLYHKLLIYFYDNDILNKFDIKSENLDSVIVRLKYLFDNNLHNITENKIWRNSIWIKEISSMTHAIFDLYYQYMRMVYDEIMINHNWLYIDTDTFYILGDIKDCDNIKSKLSYLSIEITYRNKPYIFLEGPKSYVYSDGSTLRYRGLRYSTGNDKSKLEKIESVMNIYIRNDKFNKLLL